MDPSPQQRRIAAAAPPDSMCVIDVDGDLDMPAFQTALNRVTTRHALHGLRAAISPGMHRLVLTVPASRADARSLRNLFHELVTGEEPEVLPYERFAAWQNAVVEEDSAVLPPVAPLPFEPGEPGAGEVSLRLDPEGLEAAAARCGLSLRDFLLTCWTTVLWQQTGAPDLAIGLVADGRVFEELEPVIGPCAKALPVLAHINETDPLGQVAQHLRQAATEALDGQAYWDHADLTWGFDHADLPPSAHAFGALLTPRDDLSWTAPFALTLRVRRSDSELLLTLAYERSRADEAMAGCLLEHLVALAAHAEPATPVGRLSGVGPEQAERLAAVNRTAVEFADGRCAHQLFEEQAAKEPDRIAVSADGRDTCYGELNARANRLARRLRELGAGPEELVGIRLERGLDMLVAVLAVHKAGAAYVPIDPGHPGERVRVILEDTRLPIMISHTELDMYQGKTLLLDGDPPGDGEDLALDTRPDQLAYVLHTSGSTGRPKGVQVSHGAFTNFLHAMRRRPGLRAEDSLVAVTTLSFDISGLELYLPLVCGARVTIASRATAADPSQLAALLERAEATVLQATPVTWRMLLTSGWTGRPGLTALVGGEALPPDLAGALRPRVRQLWNMYGPTETTIWSTCGEVGSGPVTVGQPIANTCVHVLDRELSPVAVGLVGEVYIGGAGLARGYAGRPGLTAERFVPDPGGGRMYRTGDLARLDPLGRLHVLGRSDGQVKIRGFRVELGEVEVALSRHPSVRAAVATTAADPSGSLRLEAHVVLSPGAQVLPGSLRAYLEERLPEAMVPARIGILSALPLTANGKVDRAALPEITGGSGGEHVPAGTRLEHSLAEIWREVLQLEEVGMTDNFFDLGGHSVLLVRVADLVMERLSLEITALTLLEHPTINALAGYLTRPPDADGETRGLGGRELLLQRRRRAEGQ